MTRLNHFSAFEVPVRPEISVLKPNLDIVEGGKKCEKRQHSAVDVGLNMALNRGTNDSRTTKSQSQINLPRSRLECVC